MKYHQRTIVIFITFFWNCLAGAQHVIIGVVCDKETKLPVADVYVNLDESIHAITNISGKFEVKTNLVDNAKMTLHHVAYQTLIIDSPFNGLPDTLFIVEQVNRIPEIAITARKKNKKSKIIKHVAIVEFIIGNDDSFSSVKIIRSTGYPALDGMALQYYANDDIIKSYSQKPRGKPVREKHTFRR